MFKGVFLLSHTEQLIAQLYSRLCCHQLQRVVILVLRTLVHVYTVHSNSICSIYSFTINTPILVSPTQSIAVEVNGRHWAFVL